MMSNQQTGQVIRSAAEIYDEFFVPALFGEWAEPVADAAQLAPGQQVLDVACGTGVLARAVHRRVQPGGAVIGVDINEGMLSVARKKAPAIDFREGNVQALPLDDAQFDAVVCQFGLMFFTDRVQAIQEMMRVLQPGGRMAVAVWDAVENIEGYAPLANLMDQLYGQETGDAVRSPFVLGNADLLRDLFADAGADTVELIHGVGTMRFPSLRDWLTTEIRGWILADRLNDEQFEEFLSEATSILAPYVMADGSVALKAPAFIVTMTKE
ncbi:MAG: methyltransferase domain-containing protein [Caldilineaceae bacterium]